MAGKEPLVTTLKTCILSMQAEGCCPVTDTSLHLASFCEVLEMILRKGMTQPVLGFKKRDYWTCLEECCQLDDCCRLPQLSVLVERTNSCEKLLSTQGRGRYFLRLALSRRFLGTALRHLVCTPKMQEWYDPQGSILAHEDFREPFLSLVLVVSEMSFSLDLENSSFLDESWLLPVCGIYETVPCRELGMELRYLEGRIFVTEVLPGSQTEIDEVVLAGDVIDEINGVSLRYAVNGQAGTVLNKLKGVPLKFRLIRWKWHDGAVYRPLLPYLKVLREKVPAFQLQHRPRDLEPREDRCLQDGRLLYVVRYLGQANVGVYGGKEVLDRGILMVLEQRLPSKVLFRHSYPDISSVGRRLDNANIFALCTVDTKMFPPDTTFNCLVFQTNSSDQCEEIIKRIATGFKHTEWFV
ncbi:uncharacterized protein [Ambystoma mexicanum]|uniref:uncharacterized protein isoform X2 n=1 Tax=Ambystoma mexicanum TaxID=8296 RepID=UPI0037E70508